MTVQGTMWLDGEDVRFTVAVQCSQQELQEHTVCRTLLFRCFTVEIYVPLWSQDLSSVRGDRSEVPLQWCSLPASTLC